MAVSEISAVVTYVRKIVGQGESRNEITGCQCCGLIDARPAPRADRNAITGNHRMFLNWPRMWRLFTLLARAALPNKRVLRIGQ